MVLDRWTIRRIMAHDIPPSVQLGMQGNEMPELGGLSGHVTETPLAEGQSVGRPVAGVDASDAS